jgi:cytochrome c biogenesis protein CcmG/thiol:disulfide interchange protein DsbE
MPYSWAVSFVKATAALIGRWKLATGMIVIGIAAIIVVVVAASGGTRGTSSASASTSSSGSTSGSAPAGGVATGSAAPDFTVAVLGSSGQHITLGAQYHNKPVIVNFWASWCTPCQQETPLLARWYQQQHGTVSLVGLDENDSETAAAKFAREKGVTYPLGFDPQTTVAKKYDISGIPQTFFLNAQHRVVDHVYGAVTTADLAKGVTLMTSG